MVRMSISVPNHSIDRYSQSALDVQTEAAGAVANAWQGWHELFTHNDITAAVSRFQRALVAAPFDLDVLRSASVAIATVGRIDEAVELGEYVMAHDPLNLRSYRSPFYDPIRDDPRWDRLLTTIGLSNRQLAALDLRFSTPL